MLRSVFERNVICSHSVLCQSDQNTQSNHWPTIGNMRARKRGSAWRATVTTSKRGYTTFYFFVVQCPLLKMAQYRSYNHLLYTITAANNNYQLPPVSTVYGVLGAGTQWWTICFGGLYSEPTHYIAWTLLNSALATLVPTTPNGFCVWPSGMSASHQLHSCWLVYPEQTTL